MGRGAQHRTFWRPRRRGRADQKTRRPGAHLYLWESPGVHGACVAGSETMKNFLINHARPFIYSTALPPHSVKAIDCAFDYLKENNQLQIQLRKRIDYFLQKAKWENKIPS